MLLDVKNIDVLYDDFQVIWDISINVNKAEMVALLGPNGSGKSTILNTISNLVHHRNGSIHFENNLISEIPTHKRTELGISHVLERRRVFPHLTVLQNLLLGAWHPKAKEQLDNSLSKIYKIFPKLEVRSSQLARTKSGGEQQMLAIARGMMGLPKLLMVDEPFLGLSPMVMKDLIKIFKNNEIPVFWACGVTPQSVLENSKPDFCITHSPGKMLITDKLNNDLAAL